MKKRLKMVMKVVHQSSAVLLILVLVVATYSTSCNARGLIDLVHTFTSKHSYPITSTSTSTSTDSIANNNNLIDLNSEISIYSPYRECIQSCKSCACTQVWPPDLSLCLCLDPGKYRGRSLPYPYKDCKKSCESACACTLVYPIELSECICLNPGGSQ